MEHTHGPWISTEEGDANFYFVMAPDKQWLMRIQQNGELTLAEQRQNMKLVCTAPELLEALSFCKSVIQSQGLFDLSERMAFDKAEAAIKKATE